MERTRDRMLNGVAGKILTESDNSSHNDNQCLNHAIQHEEQYIHLFQWMKNDVGDFQNDILCPAMFTTTGRGIMTKLVIRPPQTIISIPKPLMITHSSIMHGHFGRLMGQHRVPPIEKMCLFLLWQLSLRSSSFWYPYLCSLPQKYDIPAYFSEYELSCLPEDLLLRSVSQKDIIHSQYEAMKPTASELTLIQYEFTKVYDFEHYLWAWSTINTRSVHMDDEQGCALAPFLDLLNHSPEANVIAGYNSTSQCYEIKTLDLYQKFEQVFISYGAHDNSNLMVEYGFVSHTENIHDVVPVTMSDLKKVAIDLQTKDLSKKLLFMSQHALDDQLHFSTDGLSWNLCLCCQLLSVSHVDHKLKSWYTSHEPNHDEVILMHPFIIALLSMKMMELSACVGGLNVTSSMSEYRARMIRSLLEKRIRILEANMIRP